MNITDDLSFEEWFDLFLDRVRKHHNYNGQIDKYSFESDYEIDNKTPEQSADEFVAEVQPKELHILITEKLQRGVVVRIGPGGMSYEKAARLARYSDDNLDVGTDEFAELDSIVGHGQEYRVDDEAEVQCWIQKAKENE
ncbi:MAG: hypothetical protein AAFY91_06665 [Bacteroidota bacterium]